MNIDDMKVFMNEMRILLEDRVFWHENAWKRGDKIDMTVPVSVEAVLGNPLLITVNVTVDVDTPPRVAL